MRVNFLKILFMAKESFFQMINNMWKDFGKNQNYYKIFDFFIEILYILLFNSFKY